MDAQTSQKATSADTMLEITEVRISRRDEVKLKAFASITLCDCLVIRDLKVIQGQHRLFVAMPSRQQKDGTYQDLVHPVTPEFRRRLEEAVLGAFFHTPPRSAMRERSLPAEPSSQPERPSLPEPSSQPEHPSLPERSSQPEHRSLPERSSQPEQD